MLYKNIVGFFLMELRFNKVPNFFCVCIYFNSSVFSALDAKY